VQPAAFFEKPYDSKELLASINLLLAPACIPPISTVSPPQLSLGSSA